MSIVRIIRHGDCPEIAWKNGGGTTREIAVFPPGAGIDDFLWRLSMATVETAGPFSAFDGVDRVLTVIDGVLDLLGPDIAIELTAASAPFAFDGGAAVTGRPLRGPVVDLNAMVRRGRYKVAVARLCAGDIVVPAETSFLFALEPQAIAGAALARWDCAEIDSDVTATADILHVGMTTDR